MAITLSSALLLVGCAQSTSDSSVVPTNSAFVSSATVEFLDESTIHEIALEFDQVDYESMLSEYRANGEKAWINITVTIDGSTYESAGVRLKGNSSLRTLTGGGRGGAGEASLPHPEDLPWLIRLDKYVDGQSHGGVTDFVVRSNTTETALNEAVALDLLEVAGLASQDQAYAAFSVNDSESTLRLIVENPDDIWLEATFATEGILYKAESTGDYSFRGESPESYDEVFDIEAGEGDGDLTPLIEFLDFINNSDDETFFTELPERLDIDAFATYLAIEDLIGNFDDIDGPGNNSYLFYDIRSRSFTVVPWDHNLAFDVMNDGGPGQTPGVGGDSEGMPPREGRGPGGGSNLLVERFLAVGEWQDLYDEATRRLQVDIFDSGLAEETLAGWVGLLQDGASQLVADDAITTDAEAIESSVP